MGLSGKQRQFLRAQAHHLDPVVTVGKDGLGGSVLAAVGAALADHELIKVRVLEGAGLDRKEAGNALAQATGAERVGELGRIVILYKRHPERPSITLPRGR